MFAKLKELWKVSRENKRLRKKLAKLNVRITRQKDRIRLLKEGGETSHRIRPENIIWIFGSGRTGSTWLARMMGELTKASSSGRRNSFWNEPWAGHIFYLAIEQSEAIGRKGKGFILAPHYKSTWLRSIKGFVLDGADARFPEMHSGDHLVIKEPGGSVGAPLLMEALPESCMVFLVRDPRDVVASQADAHGEGGFMSPDGAGDPSSEERAISAAKRYLRNIQKSKQAYESHKGRKVLVRYEDLRADTLGTMKRVYSSLEIPVEDERLAQAVRKYSWENIPEEEKGSGKKFRKATPGGWREDLTPEQVKTVERIAAPVLEEFYSDSALQS